MLFRSALPTQEIVGKSYKILHSSTRSVQGAVDRILALCQTHNLPARVYMESTSIYHLPLYYRLKEAGLEVFVLNPIVTHANQNTNIRNIHNDKLDARRIALLGLRPDLKTSLIPEDEIAAVKALLREYHVMKKETSTYICRLKNQLRQIFPQYLPHTSSNCPPSKISASLRNISSVTGHIPSVSSSVYGNIKINQFVQ